MALRPGPEHLPAQTLGSWPPWATLKGVCHTLPGPLSQGRMSRC